MLMKHTVTFRGSASPAPALTPKTEDNAEPGSGIRIPLKVEALLEMGQRWARDWLRMTRDWQESGQLAFPGWSIGSRAGRHPRGFIIPKHHFVCTRGFYRSSTAKSLCES